MYPQTKCSAICKNFISKLLHSLTILSVFGAGEVIAGSGESDLQLLQSTEQRFEIPAQELTSALNAFAEATRLQVSFPSALANGKTSPALSGRYQARQALEKLLEGSGLDYRVTENRSITLVNPRKSSLSTENLLAMSPMEKFQLAAADTEDQPYSGPVEQEDLTVRGAAFSGYTVLDSNTATKTDIPIIETPVSVQVVPRDVMDDQKTTRIKDALENVSGVRTQPTLGSGNGFIIRGFRNERVYRNGLLATGTANFPAEFDAGNLESIEVLKGPAAVLYGRIDPGGLVNINTKRPQDTPFYSLEQQFGSYEYYRSQWDATGSLTDNNSLAYRFAGAYQNNNSFRDFVFSDRVLINPSITWRPSDSTELTVDIEGLDQDYKPDYGIVAVGNRPAPIPISRSLDDPNTPTGHIAHTFVSTEIKHQFNEDWAIINRFLAGFNDEASSFINPTPSFGPVEDALAPNGTLQRNVFGQTSDIETFSTNLNLTGKFQWEFSEHDVLVGFDYFNTTVKYHYFGEFDLSDPNLDINIFNPQPSYGINPALIQSTLSNAPDCCAGFNFSFIKQEWYGVYFQDHITLWDNLHILGGGRYDWSTSGRGDAGSFAEAESATPSNKDQGFSPRVGILYQPWYFLSVYGNWTTSFGPNNAPTDGGRSLDAQRGEQFEVGLKTQLFDDRLIATLAVYHLTKDNVLVNNFDTPDPFDVLKNKQRSQGIELDVTGQITDQLSLIGSYAFTDTKILEDENNRNVGHRLPNVPDHAGSLFVKYDVNGPGAPNGFSFGIGGVAAGQRQGDFENSFQLPGYVRMDAFAAYRTKLGPSKLIVQFNIRNLLDKVYYESTDPSLNVLPALAIAPGAPLTAIGSVRLEF